MDYKLVTIVLAAGASRRMGTPKLFLPLFGSTLLRLAVTAALDVSYRDGVVVVSGAYDQEIREHLAGIEHPTPLIITHNPAWETGMASSIAAGIRAARSFAPTHYFITLADQPRMGVETLGTIAKESFCSPESVVATYYPERNGVPAIFPAAFTDELTGQNGVFGARQLIEREGDRVLVVTFGEPPVDIDTPEDYNTLLGRNLA